MQSYDALQRLTQVVNQKTNGTDLNKFAYAYDTRDVRTGVQMQYGSEPLRQINHTYDAINQLVGENAMGGVANTNYSNAFSYDAMGNRLNRDTVQGSDSSSTRSSVNELNQLTSVSIALNGEPSLTSSLSHDAAGNLTEAATAGSGRTLYVYDDADRLFRVEKRNAADAPVSKSEFLYDYASRKAVSQEFTYTAGAWVQNSEKRRVFDGLDVVQERDELNQVTAQLVRDGNIGGILSRSNAAGATFFGYDGGGNVTLLSDENGDEVGRYRYDAFGNTLESSGARAAENPYRFSTKELHGASGLYDFGYRFYSAGMGRWINRDPIREDGGINLYAMVGNSPTNAVDEYGHSPWSAAAKQVAKRGARAQLKKFLNQTVKKTVQKVTDKKLRKQLYKDMADLLGEFDSEPWEIAVDLIPVVGDIKTITEVPCYLRAMGKARKILDKANDALKRQRAAAKVALKLVQRAKELGYNRRIPAQKAFFDSHGQDVFFNGKGYISRDIDGHNVTNGWKMFDRKGRRTGTWNSDLTKLLKK